MADDKTSPAEPTDEEKAEKHYWDEHEKRTRGVLDKWFEEKRTELSKSRTGGGRTTLPKIFADLVFGPEKTQ